MVSCAAIPRLGVEQSIGHAVKEAAAVARDLARIGIDDLAKYRIFCHLNEQPFVPMEASACAVSLGLHSLAETTALLEELASAGVVVRRHSRLAQGPVYSWPGVLEVSRQVLRLQQAARDCRVEVLRSLASRSLARARKRSRNNGARDTDNEVV